VPTRLPIYRATPAVGQRRTRVVAIAPDAYLVVRAYAEARGLTLTNVITALVREHLQPATEK
jgi:hypothetical protein